MASEFRDRVFPPWLPRQVHEPPFVLKVLEALTTEGCRDNVDHERCVMYYAVLLSLWNACLDLLAPSMRIHVRHGYAQQHHACMAAHSLSLIEHTR